MRRDERKEVAYFRGIRLRGGAGEDPEPLLAVLAGDPSGLSRAGGPDSKRHAIARSVECSTSRDDFREQLGRALGLREARAITVDARLTEIGLRQAEPQDAIDVSDLD